MKLKGFPWQVPRSQALAGSSSTQDQPWAMGRSSYGCHDPKRQLSASGFEMPIVSHTARAQALKHTCTRVSWQLPPTPGDLKWQSSTDSNSGTGKAQQSQQRIVGLGCHCSDPKKAAHCLPHGTHPLAITHQVHPGLSLRTSSSWCPPCPVWLAET